MHFRSRPAGQEENLTPLDISFVTRNYQCVSSLFQLTEKIPAVKTSKKNTEPPEHLSPHPDEAPPPEKAKPARQLENHPSHCPVGTRGPTESLWPPLYLKGLAGSKPWEPLAKIKISYLWVLINPLKFSFVRLEPPPLFATKHPRWKWWLSTVSNRPTPKKHQPELPKVKPCPDNAMLHFTTKLFRSNLWIHQRWS